MYAAQLLNVWINGNCDIVIQNALVKNRKLVGSWICISKGELILLLCIVT